MKRTIDGIQYDTDKSEAIAGYSNGQGHDDLQYYAETLYRTSDGHYFLRRSAGAEMSAHPIIDPLTVEQARAFVRDLARDPITGYPPKIEIA